MNRHITQLKGPQALGARVSIHVIRALTDALVDVAQRSLRLRMEGRSHLVGQTKWLERATDLQLVGLSEGSTVLEWEAPTLGEAAPAVFDQASLWDFSPRREQTAFSLIEEAVQEAVAGNADSDWLDRNVLEAISEFQNVLNYGFESLILNGPTHPDQKIEVTTKGLTVANKLKEEAPSPERVVVSGVLDQLTHSTRGFRLFLSNGQTLRGVLPSGPAASYSSLWGQKVTVDGEARFKPSKTVLLIQASHVQLAAPEDAGWEKVPLPRPRALEDLKPAIPPPPGSNGMEKVFGHWPGEETTEELLAALEELD